MRDIQERTGIPRSTIRENLVKQGLIIKGADRRHSIRSRGQAPYGFAYLDNKLVIDPKEHLIVREILNLHKKGHSLRAIAEELNGQKKFNRKGTKWHHCIISSVIEYHNKLKK